MPIRERVLKVGVQGVGKSYQWLKMAEMCPNNMFRCIDADASIAYMIDTQFPHLKLDNGGNVQIFEVFEWDEYMEALNTVLSIEKGTYTRPDKKQKQRHDVYKLGDWLTLEMMEAPWKAAQRYFIESVFQKSKGKYLLEVRRAVEEKAKKITSISKEAMEGWTDWPVVNSLYDDYMLPIIYRVKSHVYATTRPDRIDAKDDPEIKMVFGSLGVKPAGQKQLGHQFHTVMLLTAEPPKKKEDNYKWYITTAKDRAGRTYFNQVRLTSFYLQYLVAKAGWQAEGESEA